MVGDPGTRHRPIAFPVAIRAAQVGFLVVGYDASLERVKSLQAASSFIDDVSDEDLRSTLSRRYLPTLTN